MTKEEYLEKGKEILDEKYHDLWEKYVPIRLDDIYEGMELGACLEIIKELNNGCDLNDAMNIIENQDHSGRSFRIVCALVAVLCDRGIEFVNFLKQFYEDTKN